MPIRFFLMGALLVAGYWSTPILVVGILFVCIHVLALLLHRIEMAAGVASSNERRSKVRARFFQ